MVEFINVFLSYLMLMLIIIVVAAIGFSIGLFLRKKKNSKKAAEVVETVV